ncbi:YccF domain-containing protein [Patulibacter sp. SYSU D01012]|uniref:YccF domain-containing protein n=1 Tax=Patulibacter sp. SYSU D01012 TaxID=2817381 RepID=UPI001B310C84
MRLVLNVLWLVLSGFWMALGYVLAGLVLLLPIVTIPFSLAAFRIAGFCLWPFGRTLVPHRGSGALAGIGNVIWIVFAGWWLALGHLLTGAALCLTVVGIPFGIANFKLIPVSLVPLGSRVVPLGSPEAQAGVAV